MKIYIIFILAVTLVCLSGENILADQPLYPLEPADRSSPRASLQTFLDDMNKALEAYKANHNQDAVNLAHRAAQCLDLESKPPAIRDTLAFESVIYLKEILDRIDIPPVDEIPDKKDVKTDKLDSWSIPHTEITIAVVNKGPAEGQFLFTSNTVANLEKFYSKIEGLPYKTGSGGGAVRSELISSSGLVIIRRMISYLPPWTMTFFFGQMVWQWIGLGVYFFFGAAAILLIYKCTRTVLAALDSKLDSSLEKIIGGVVLPLGLILFSIFGLWFILHGLHMVNVYSPLSMVFLIIGYSGALWLIGAILNRIAGTVIRVGGFVTGNADTQLIRFGFDLITVGIILATIVHFGGRLGLPTYSLVGGLGIGGLAIALAGREALSNLIGTIVIPLDRPFKMGDYVLIGDKVQGTVLNIGLSSTRVYTLNGRFVSIPNANV
ncbi:MAG: mechanosensitive ion channel family protein [Pseudomonadota bacterium]